jgi:hypothetical protein
VNCSRCGEGFYSETTDSGVGACSTVNAGYGVSIASESGDRVGQTPCAAGSYSTGRADACIQCEAGKHQGSNTSLSCEACGRGWYANFTGATACIKCPANHKCPVASDPPQPCPDGIPSMPGSVECLPCAKGEMSDAGAKCTGCTVGHYSFGAGATSCTACDPGQYQDEVASGSCKQCATGTNCTNATREPEACPAGQYSNPAKGTVACTLCGPGTNQAKAAQSSCQPCDVGNYTTDQGSTACQRCPAGYSCTTASATPLPCDPGYFASAGETRCTRASAGWATRADQSGEIRCSPGSYSGSGSYECSLCRAGQNQPEPGETSCPACPLKTVSSEEGATSCLTVPDGNYSEDRITQKTCEAAIIAMPVIV